MNNKELIIGSLTIFAVVFATDTIVSFLWNIFGMEKVVLPGKPAPVLRLYSALS